MSDKTKLQTLNIVLLLIGTFVVSPLVLMFVWNTLVVYLFGLTTIGYGGAWAIMTIRMLLFTTNTERKEQGVVEDLADTGVAFFKLTSIAIVALIVAVSIGAI